MPGQPDWQKSTQVTEGALIASNTLDVASGSSYDSGNVQVASWSSVILACKLTAGYGILTLANDIDTIGSAVVPSYVTPMPVGYSLLTRLPVLSQYMRLTLTNASGVTMQGSIYLAGSSAAVSRADFPAINDGYYLAETSVPVTSAVTVPISDIWGGACVVSIRPYDSTAKLICSLQSVTDSGGAANTIADLGNPTAAQIYNVAIPPQPSELYIYNFDTSAAHSVRASVVRA